MEVLGCLQQLEREVETATGVIILHEKKCSEVNEVHLQKAKEILTDYGKALNEKLGIKTFVAGAKATVADISIYYNLSHIKG